MDTLNASITVNSDWRATENLLGAETPIALTDSDNDSLSFLIGSASTQVNAVYYEERELAAGTSEELDLLLLLLKESNLNLPLSFGKVNSIKIRIVENEDESAMGSGLRIGNATANRWDGWLSAAATEDVDREGIPYSKASYVGRVVDASNRYLKILNLDSLRTITYQILIYGVKN